MPSTSTTPTADDGTDSATTTLTVVAFKDDTGDIRVRAKDWTPSGAYMALWEAVEREIDLQAMDITRQTGLRTIGTAEYDTDDGRVTDLNLDDSLVNEYGW